MAPTKSATASRSSLDWPADEVTCVDGRLHRGPSRIALSELVGRAGGEIVAEGSVQPPGRGRCDAGPDDMATRRFGVVFVEVGVDETLGNVRLRRATGVYSAGRIINERTARSQIIGGIVWGWGMASGERSVLEPVLGRWNSQNLAGVALPVNADIPAEIDVSFVDEVDDNAGPLRAKGIGELSATGVAAAVANAVFDAVGIGLGTFPSRPRGSWKRRVDSSLLLSAALSGRLVRRSSSIASSTRRTRPSSGSSSGGS